MTDTKLNTKILVVDDEEHTRLGYAEVLEMEGYKVSTAENALIGLDMAENEKFEIIVTDLRMPEMDGLTFVEKLREFDKGVKVIMITAFGSYKTYKKAADCGIILYLNKPVRAAELMEGVKTVMESN
jgi:two-component system response regulator (stage 0 sporulation protein F)